jgi:Tfp pilus assembly protein FimT
LKKFLSNTAVIRYVHGFSLVELLLLVVSLGIVASFLVPAFTRTSEWVPSISVKASISSMQSPQFLH